MNKREMPLISVIVPVYMVSDYLDRCIISLVNQSYNTLEIILVDDGSPDECAVMCDKWAEKDIQVTVIHKTNGGLSDARNHGMQIAVGEYVSFIDSDDYVSEDFLEVLLSTAIKRDSDIVECSCVNVYENRECDEYHDDLSESDYSDSDGLLALVEENPFHQHVWDKLYKREIVHNITFEVGKQHEDVFWTYQVFGQAKKITKINRTMYFYLQRESSIMGRGYTLRSLDFLEGKWSRQLYIEKMYPELALKAKLDFFGSCMYMMQSVIKYMYGFERRQAIAAIKNYKKKCNLKFKDLQSVKSGAKKYYYLAKINLFLCCKLRADLNICF